MCARWVAPPVERVEPELLSDERAALEQWLDYHRATLLTKCAGLDAELLKHRAIPPSQLSLLGLVRHLAEVERWWFRVHVGGEQLPEIYCTPQNQEADFDDLEDADPQADLETYRRECAAARGAAAGRGLDDVVESHGHHRERVRNVRWIYLHMLEEYARHNGHADLIREEIDGAVGD